MNATSPRQTGIPDPVACDKAVPENSHQIDIQWGVPRDPSLPDDSILEDWVGAALAWLECEESAVSIRMMDSEEMLSLNRRYRDKAEPTNVLSFSADGEDEAGRRMLGDLAVCIDVVRQEAAGQGKSLAAHVAQMLVHGVLHLSGYDHVEDEEARAMELAEAAILAGLGFADPYENAVMERGGDHE
jgi:probable rRNA maturation factor